MAKVNFDDVLDTLDEMRHNLKHGMISDMIVYSRKAKKDASGLVEYIMDTIDDIGNLYHKVSTLSQVLNEDVPDEILGELSSLQNRYALISKTLENMKDSIINENER